MPRIGADLRETIIYSLAGKSGREAKAIIEDLHEQTRLSIGYLYKLTDPVRLNGRAQRRDAGRRRIDLPPGAWEFMTGLTSKYDLDAEQVIDIAELNAVIPKGLITPVTYNAWLREEGISRNRFNQDVKPYTPWEAKEPNLIHHFDTTKLEELHYEDGVLTWDPRANRKNSRGEKPDPIWLYSMVDDCSRAKFAFLYRSENQYNHLDFLFQAWSEKSQPTEFPFYGVPDHLYMDKGKVNYSLKVINALQKLGVHIIPTTPSTAEAHGSRKHGKVENPFKTYNKWLKGLRPRLDAGGLTWEEAQESLYQFLLKINNRVHSTTGAPPFQRWLQIGKPKHTPPEELWLILKHENDRRRVNADLTFSINNHVYRLPEKLPFINWTKEWVEVYWLKDRYEKVYAVRGAVEVEVKEVRDNVVRPAFSYPREKREATAVERIRAQAAGLDYSTVKLWSTDENKTAYMPKKGEAFDGTRIAEKTVAAPDGTRRPSFAPMLYLSKFEAVRKLRETGIIVNSPISKAEKAWVDSLFAGREKISEEELDAVIAETQPLAEGEE